jgi:uncharacterized protein (DUF58 family)
MVKELELDPLAEVWVFLDNDQSVHASLPFTPVTSVDDALFQTSGVTNLTPATIEYCIIVGASLARYYLRRGRAVGLVTGGEPIEVLPPDRGGRQLGKILEALALLSTESDLPFSSLVAGQARYIPRGSTIVLISPSVRKELGLIVDQVSRLGLRPVVVLIDAESFGGSVGTKEQAAIISSMGIPVTTITNGDDIGEVLSSGSALGDMTTLIGKTTAIL